MIFFVIAGLDPAIHGAIPPILIPVHSIRATLADLDNHR